ncbi:MAG: pyruvate kinase [Phycisphaerales bacterium]
MTPAEPDYSKLLEQMAALRRELTGAARTRAALIGAAAPDRAASVTNMIHYAALRSADRRELQMGLAAAGFSSLGRSEAHALFTVRRVESALRRLTGLPDAEAGAPEHAGVSLAEGQARMETNTRLLLGPAHADRRSRIMVTLPGEAAGRPALLDELLEAGTDLIRINCAHDGPEAWLAMIAHTRAAAARFGRDCPVMMDLPGPKVRTGPIAPGPEVVRCSPVRSAVGDIVRPARVLLRPAETAPIGFFASGPVPIQSGPIPDAVLPLSGAVLGQLREGDVLEFRDHRGAERDIKIVRRAPSGDAPDPTMEVWAEAWRTAYITPGCVMRVRRRSAGTPQPTRGDPAPPAPLGPPALEIIVGHLPASESSILIRTGEQVILTADQSPGRVEIRSPEGVLVEPGRLPITLPIVLNDVRPGERVLLDDGKASGVIESCDRAHMVVRLTRAPAAGLRLRADKGINLPDSQLRIPAMSEQDERDLAFIAQHADLVGLSFARAPEDLRHLGERLAELGAGRLGVVLKVETRAAFERLPELLLELMRFPTSGVMIARGDLAVEMGWERLAEVQEEVLWLCESAHVPVIWATQVLESLAKKGLASRSEITDAAAGQRAECVMLNKGPNVADAVRALDLILRRMDDHQMKKRAMLRPLALARRFLGEATDV